MLNNAMQGGRGSKMRCHWIRAQIGHRIKQI